MIYRIFQCQIDRDKFGHNSPEFEMYYRATCFPKVAAVKAAWDAGMYELTGLIDPGIAELEAVFEVGNFMDKHPEMIAKMGRMRSVSVGDIIVDEMNKRVYVDSFGFKEF